MSFATLNGYRVSRARITIPAARNTIADVQLEADQALAIGSAATLVIGGLSIVGTIVIGGVYVGAGSYRLIAGAAGWGKPVAAQSYALPSGVQLSMVLGDVASLCGETIAIVADRSVGPSFVRQRCTGSRVLEQLVPGAWYVDPTGVTQIATRPTGVVDPTTYEGIARHAERGLAEFATETPETLVPNLAVTIDGFTFAPQMIRHILDAGAIRTEAWERAPDDLSSLVRECFPRLDFLGSYEYRVAAQSSSGAPLDLTAADPTLGLPDVAKVPIRGGVPGATGQVQPGALVLVSFVNGDPGRPIVTAFDDPSSGGYTATRLDLVGADDVWNPLTEKGRVVRYGDQIAFPVGAGGTPTALPITGVAVPPITSSVSRVRA